MLSFFVAKIARVIAVSTGRDTPEFPYFAEMVVGGYIIIVTHLVWVARRHLRDVARKAFSVRPVPATRTPEPKPPSASEESSVVRFAKPGVMAFETLFEIVSARRDAAVRPEVALPSALLRFI